MITAAPVSPRGTLAADIAGGVTTFFTMAYIVVVNPLTLSITQGILWGFLLHALLYSIAGRAREVAPALWALAVMSALFLGFE